MGFSSSTIEFHPILYRIPEKIVISKSDCKHIGIILDRIIGTGDPEVFVDQASDLSSSKESVFFVSFHFLQTDLSLEAGILDDSVQC